MNIKYLVALAAILGAIASPSSADAATWTNVVGRSGWSGKASSFADTSCFSNFWGGVTNTCSTNKLWMIPAGNIYTVGPLSHNMDSGGVYVKTTGSPGGYCYIVGTNTASSSGIWYSATQNMSSSGLAFSTPPSMAAALAIDVYCSMPQNSVVGPIHYVQTDNQ